MESLSKVCRKCHQEKGIDEYSIKNGRPAARCKKCIKEAKDAYRKANPEKIKEYQKAYMMRKRQQKSPSTRRKQNPFDLDHFIPLACGWGADSFLNVTYIPFQWNRSKLAQHPFEWADRYFALPDAFGTRAQFDAVAQEIADRNGITVEYLREVCDWAFANARTVEEADMDAELFGRVDAIGAYQAVQKTKQELSEILGTTEDTEWITKLIA